MSKEKNQNQSLLMLYRRLLAYLRPYLKQFIIALVAMIIYGVTDGAVPLLIKSVLDDVFGDKNRDILYLLPLLIVIFAVARGGFGFLQRYLTACIGFNIIRDIRNQIHNHLLALSPQFFSSQSTGALISRMTNDTLLVRSALTDAAATVLRDSIRILSLLAVALYLDPVLALIAFVGLPLCLLPIVIYGKHIRRLSRSGQEQLGGVTSVLQESITGHNTIQSFQLEHLIEKRFEEENNTFTKTFCRAERYGALSGPTNEFVASLAIAGVILYGGFSVLSESRTQGDFLAFLTAMFLLYEPVKKLSRLNSAVQTGLAAASRIFDLLDTAVDIADCPGATDLELPVESIEYKDVCFRYGAPVSKIDGNSAEKWVLNSINLKIRAGETIALVGMSGGGKSTLVRLLPRFFEVNSGSIIINDRDIKNCRLESLRNAVSVVDQRPFLFNDTVYNNIRYGRLNAGREEVYAAAEAGNALTFIDNLSDGFETVLGEQGLSLSGGERARLAIARALLKNAPILVLDEATAALDSESEKLVQEAVDRLMVGRTVLVIAHRLVTVRNADRIVVVKEGQIVEAGSHVELLARGGEYSRLYEIQFRHDHSVGVEPLQRIAADG